MILFRLCKQYDPCIHGGLCCTSVDGAHINWTYICAEASLMPLYNINVQLNNGICIVTSPEFNYGNIIYFFKCHLTRVHIRRHVGNTWVYEGNTYGDMLVTYGDMLATHMGTCWFGNTYRDMLETHLRLYVGNTYGYMLVTHMRTCW